MNKKQVSKITPNIIISCFLAGCLEMYDFLLFGFFAPIIHVNYLSFLDEKTGVMIAYLLFAVGFLFRPLGAFIFGHIGDKYGRKKAVVLSVSFMGTASLCMTLLPSYQTIGVLSCWFIVLIRIIQGISVGGEYSGVTIYAMEHTTKKSVGIIGSLVVTGSLLGVLLATLVSKFLQSSSLPDYSWRFAFLLGFSLSIIGYFIRRRLTESPLFEKSKSNLQEMPLMYGLRFFKKKFVASVLLAGANNANIYFILMFLPGFLKSYAPDALDFNTFFMTCIMIGLVPVIGWVSDKTSRSKILIFTYTFFIIYLQFLLQSISSTSSELVIWGHVLTCAFLLSSSIAVVNIYVLEIFPTKCRFSCGALSYSAGTAIFGGTAPFMCSLIFDKFGQNPYYLTIYISSVSLLGLIGALLGYRTEKSNNDQEHQESLPLSVLQNS